MPRRPVAPEVELEWSETEVRHFLDDPSGELGRTLMTAIGEVVLAGARRRALRRTGKMAGEMYFEVGRDEFGVHTDIISPAVNPKTGFPYPMAHEGKHVRDRRPHRSLRPALRDVRKVAPTDQGGAGARVYGR